MAKAKQLRKCIGSERYGIKPHEVPIDEFPKQPSQKDGLGRMCRTHWNEYTAGLARDRKARQADDAAAAATAPARAKPAKARKPDAPVKGETPAVTGRRRAFEKRLAKVGPSSEEGQRMMEQAGKARNGKAIAATREDHIDAQRPEDPGAPTEAELEARLRDDPPGAIASVGQGGEESSAA